MNPVGSCLICRKQDELAIWLDPDIIAEGYYPYHGVCFACREAAQPNVQRTAEAVPQIGSLEQSNSVNK
jgi:hypothetical protein